MNTDHGHDALWRLDDQTGSIKLPQVIESTLPFLGIVALSSTKPFIPLFQRAVPIIRRISCCRTTKTLEMPGKELVSQYSSLCPLTPAERAEEFHHKSLASSARIYKMLLHKVLWKSI